jgi:2-polyprenyl-3-methyl-5-hydroxy-6-metoxy-1,4-benzoquinol methylase
MKWKGFLLNRCPACDSNNISSAGARLDGAKVSKCEKCHIGFLNPMPESNEIEEMYDQYFSREDGIGYPEYPLKLFTTPTDYFIWEAIKKYSFRHESINKKALDVGCAFGARVDFFRRKGIISSGIDISIESIKYGREKWGLDLHAGRFEDIAINDSYDYLMMIDFIEHLPNPMQWVMKANKIVHAGSLLIILTPNFECYETYGPDWSGYGTSFEHLFFYNRDSLDYVLSAGGFEIVEVNGLGISPPISHSNKKALTAVFPGLKIYSGLLNQVQINRLRAFRGFISLKLQKGNPKMNLKYQHSLFAIARKL